MTKTFFAARRAVISESSASPASGSVDGPMSSGIGMRLCAPGSTLFQYRNTPSERYRVKAHRLSFGLKDSVTTPDYDQLLRDLADCELRTKGKGKS